MYDYQKYEQLVAGGAPVSDSHKRKKAITVAVVLGLAIVATVAVYHPTNQQRAVTVARMNGVRGIQRGLLSNTNPVCDAGNDWSYTETISTGRSGVQIRTVSSTGCPNHAWTSINPNSPQHLSNNDMTIYADPCFANEIHSIACEPGSVGKAFNGVTFFSQWASDPCGDAVVLEGSTFDTCSGHASGQGIYHYHIPPSCVLTDLENSPGEHSPQIGWGLDGLPIHGPQGQTGNLVLPCSHAMAVSADCVDECNGHWHTVTGSEFLYHYHFLGPIGDGTTLPVSPLPTEIYWPYFPGCFRGVVHPREGGSGQTCVSRNFTSANYVVAAMNPLHYTS